MRAHSNHGSTDEDDQQPLSKPHKLHTGGPPANVHTPQYKRGSSCQVQPPKPTPSINGNHLRISRDDSLAVPLASMDDFSDAATSVVSCASSRPTHNTDTDDTPTDESYSILKSSNAEQSAEESDTDEVDVLTSMAKHGPRRQTSFMNHHRPSLMYQLSWIEKGIESTEDLERIFVQNSGNNHTNNHVDVVTDTSHDPRLTHSCDFIDFAEKFFNVHCISSRASNALSKTVNFVKRRSQQDFVAMEQLICYTRNSSIPTSHLRFLNQANVVLAQQCFKDICKYMHGEVKAEAAFITLRGIMALAIEHTELRDEIYCQLMRQASGNPREESQHRVWHIMALSSVCFNPSLTLYHYLMTFLKQHSENNDDNIANYAAYSSERLGTTDRKTRKMPPAFPEIEAVVCLQPVSHPVHFLNGRCELLEVKPDCSAGDAVQILADKIGLLHSQGWALYESTPEYDRHICEEEYLTDIISKWEQKRVTKFKGKKMLHRKQQQKHLAEVKLNSPKKTAPLRGSPKKNSPKMSAVKLPPLKEFGKLVFCKRIFQPVTEIPDDPLEIQLLYSQAVHYAVQLDEYNLSAALAIHLAGLQGHVEFGNYDPSKQQRYSQPRDFICDRLLKHSSHAWPDEIAAAHKKYSSVHKSVEESQMKYLTTVSQFPLYGATKIFAHYRGIWPYGAETVLAVDYEGIKFISIQEKTIAFTFYYTEIDDIILEEKRDEFYVVIQLCHMISPAQQKCFLFECLDLEDFAKCIEVHSPRHAVWLDSLRTWRHRKFRPPDDWLKLSDHVLACRRLLIEKGIISNVSQEESGLLRNALNRLGRRGSPVKKTSCEFDEEADCGELQSSFWGFSKVPFKSSLLRFQSHEMEDVAARMFNSTLVYTGLESAAVLEDMDLIVVVQTLIIKCMEKDDLCNELYLQLIKQTTTTHSELTEKAVLRYWHLMTMATCVMFPPNPVIFNYLTLHLKRYAMQGQKTEPGAYAFFCIKSLYRTLEGGGRKWPPSFKEIDFVTKRQAIEARVSLPDGHQMLVEFDSASTCAEVTQLIKAKAGMRLEAQGYGIYLVLGEEEHHIDLNEKLADSLHQWEKWAKTTGSRDLKFVFKKRLFIDPYMNLNDPIEVDLLYHQSVTDLFDQKIPLTKTDAIDLCALRAQAEFGDFGYASHFDYRSVMRILPRHLRELIAVAEIASVHRKLSGTSPMTANITFMDVLKHWPLFGATIYEVSTNSEERLPPVLWLGVTQLGVHLMEKKGQTIYLTFSFKEIEEIKPSEKNLTLVVSNAHTIPSLFFTTSEAKQILQLISNYRDAIRSSERRASKGAVRHHKSPGGKVKQARKRKEAFNHNDRSRVKKLVGVSQSASDSLMRVSSASSRASCYGDDGSSRQSGRGGRSSEVGKESLHDGDLYVPLLQRDGRDSPCNDLDTVHDKPLTACTDL